MKNLVTIAVFNNVFDVKFNLLKDMLEQAGISYVTNNEYNRTVKPMPFMSPQYNSIEVRVYEDNLEEAIQILHSIQ